MPLQGTFLADFASFQTACAQAEVSLKGFEAGSAKVESQLNRMADSLSGTKIVQQAAIAAEAVDRIGGVSKLTESELARVGTTASDAAAKLHAMGQDVPPKIQEIADAFQSAGDSTGGFVGWLKELGNSFVARVAEGVLLRDVVREFIQIGKEAITDAAAFDDLAKATGLSVEAVQRWSYVGTDFNVSTEEMARGVEQLSARLAGGDANAIKAVQMLGLSVSELIAAGPEEAFLRVAEASGKVQDPMMKGALAADEFGGKLGKILLPMLGELRQRLEDVPQRAIISDENVDRAKAFDVGLQHLITTTKSFTVEALGVLAYAFPNIVGGFKATEDGATNAGHDIALAAAATTGLTSTTTLLANRLAALRSEAMVPLNEQQKANIAELDRYGVSQKEVAQLVGTTEIAVHEYIAAHKIAEEATKKYKAAIAELQEVGVGWQGTLATINGTTVEAVRAYLAAGVAQDKLATAYGLTAAQVKSVASFMTEQIEVQKRSDRAIEETTKLWDDYDLVRTQHGGTATDVQIAQIDKWAADLTARMVKAKADTTDFYTAVAALSKEKIDGVLIDWAAVSANSSEIYRRNLQQVADKAQATFAYMLANSDQFSATTINHFQDMAIAAQNAANEWATSFESAGDKATAAVKKTAAALSALASSQTAGWSGQAGTVMSPELMNSLSFHGLIDARGLFTGTQDQFAAVVAAMPHRAAGGPVTAGQSYLVGDRADRQPELFTPGASGFISPLGGGGATVIQIYVTTPLGTPSAIAKAVDEAIMARQRNTAQRMPVS